MDKMKMGVGYLLAGLRWLALAIAGLASVAADTLDDARRRLR